MEYATKCIYEHKNVLRSKAQYILNIPFISLRSFTDSKKLMLIAIVGDLFQPGYIIIIIIILTRRTR